MIYLDNSATTKISKEALDKYNEISLGFFGNPSSLHTAGFEAERIIKEARAEVSRSIVAPRDEVIFTSSGSEANNLAILGRAFARERYKKGAKIVTTMGEHASVDEPLRALEAQGFKVARIPTRDGILDIEALKKELTPDVILLSVMLVNNETGALYDIPSAARIMRAQCPDALLHVDATQGYLKIPFTKAGLPFDMITLSSHKIEGPKGVGALVVDARVVKSKLISPIIYGGGQEKCFRSGTENVPAVAAFAEAVKIGTKELSVRAEKTEALRSYLINALKTDPELSSVSPTLPENHAPHILNITLPKIKSETMLHFLSSEGIFVSSGSACSSNSRHVSSALVAYGRSEAEADTSIRISFSYRNTKEEIDTFISALKSGLSTLSRIK